MNAIHQADQLNSNLQILAENLEHIADEDDVSEMKNCRLTFEVLANDKSMSEILRTG